MENKDKYEAVIEQYERTDSPRQQRECMFAMLKMITGNDLPHMWKMLWVIWTLSILNLIKPDGWDISSLVRIAVKLLGI